MNTWKLAFLEQKQSISALEESVRMGLCDDGDSSWSHTYLCTWMFG